MTQIPNNHKQEIYCCSMLFGGCGYVDYACNLQVTPPPRFLWTGPERLCQLCLQNDNHSDMLRMSKENFRRHVHPQHQEIVKEMLNKSGIKAEWMYQP